MKNLSKEYAYALFELSEEEDIENTILKEFKELTRIFYDNSEYINILSSYAVSKNEKISLLDVTFKFKINNYLLNFLKVLVQKGYTRILRTCFQEYEKIYNKKHNILVVTAYTPVYMTKEQIKKLTLKLESKIQKKIVILNKIESNLIGGIKIFYDENSVDISLENYFKRLHHNLEILSSSL